MRKFGIEIECVGSRDRMTEELRAAGLHVSSINSHLGFSENAWTVKRDGSVGSGGEVVSPPLDFDNASDREQVTIALEALQRAGCRPDESAGIHVHVDANDLNARQVANVGRFMFKFEDVIYRIASSGWERIRPNGVGNYCKPLAADLVAKLTKVRDKNDFYKAWYGSVQNGEFNANRQGHGSRYNGLNLHSWVYRGTIEFRVFNSSLNPKRVQGYIALAVAIVQDAREGFARSTGKSYRLGDMAAGTVKESAAIMRLQQIMRSESRDTKVLMTKEDWALVRYCWKDSKPQRAPAARW